MPPSKPLETLSRVTVLGVRFWDSVSRAMIGDGLRVSAHPPDDPGRTVRAVTNRVDTFVFYNLPGQREAEQGAGDRPYWESLPPARPFVVEVEDTAGRFLSFSFNAAVPAEGVFQWQCPLDSSPPESSGAVPLFSGPA